MRKRMTALLLSAMVALLTGCQENGTAEKRNEVVLPKRPEYVGSIFEAEAAGKSEQFQIWREDNLFRESNYRIDSQNLEGLYHGLLEGDWMQGGEDNRLVSPLCFYLSLSALAEMTEGPAQERILELCGCASLQELQEQTHSVWNRLYQEEGRWICTLGTSVWIDDRISYQQGVIDDLTTYDYASVYQGSLTGRAMQEAAKQWVSDQSQGLLSVDQVFGRDTVLDVMSMLQFSSRWGREFEEAFHFDDIFYGTKGEETVTYMQQKEMSYQYYEGDGYILVRKTLNNNGYMWFALPDEGNSPEAVWKDEMFVSMLSDGLLFDDQAQNAEVNLILPKLDLTEKVSLADPMRAMGLEELFLSEAEAFAPLTEDTVFLSDLTQQTRLIVDEQGIRAATLTQAQLDGSARPMVRIDVVLNRPFAFAVTDEQSLIYYAGTVNHIR